jgi:hypothetical protein
MSFLALSIGTGVKYSCIRVKFSLERSIMIKLCGALAEDSIGMAVRYFEVSGNNSV